MAQGPVRLRLRAYNVGFGDCLLLTFGYATGRDRNVLVDFGSTKLPENRGAKSVRQVAEQIRAGCGGKLDLVVATHRHADHISGFAGASGRIIASLDPGLVVQPWTEQPDLAPDAVAPATAGAGGPARAARAVVARLEDMHAIAAFTVHEVARRKQAGDPSDTLTRLGFLGDLNLKNSAAVLALRSLGRQQLYAKFGDVLPVTEVLPGVRIDVLGPPTIEQAHTLGDPARTDPDEFWHVAASTTETRRAGAPLFPAVVPAREVPYEARWLIPRIDRIRAEELLSIVRSIDDALNNTSLILLVQAGTTRVLLPGDAQLENWSYALRDAPNAAAIRARLADCRVYKVGHHGSLNATPKKLLWEGFGAAARPVPQRLITILSTLAGKHGSSRRATEVPRVTLVEELETHSDLVDTRGATAAEFWQERTLVL